MNRYILMAVLAVSFTTGAVTTQLVARKRIANAFDARLDDEIANYKRQYALNEFTPPDRNYVSPPDVEELLVVDEEEFKERADALKASTDYGALYENELDKAKAMAPKADAPQVRNVFTSPKEEIPYLISEEEFNAGDTDHEQVEIRYFKDDDVALDDLGEIVDDIEVKWGSAYITYISDNAMIWVRNPILKINYEISITDEHVAEFLR